VVAGTQAFDRVLLSRIQRATLVPETLHPGGREAEALLERLRQVPIVLQYPLVEHELVRRRRAQVVLADVEESPGRHPLGQSLGWRQYVAAPIIIDGAVIGFFHATRDVLDDGDAAGLAAFAVCFGLVYERAVLRQRLRVQRHELREIARWADARTSDLEDRLVTLAAEAEDDVAPAAAVNGDGHGEAALRDLLTRRELDVMRLIVRGVTNADIAKELVLSEGTVKFHVKNILRKMRAANRAEATSQYLRLTLNRASAGS
jgi:DNA-binding CsgD family transcriptional regulator